MIYRSLLYIDVVSEPTVFRNPNQSSYYPGEYVMLHCVLEDKQVDESIEYRWSSTSVISQMNGIDLTGPNLTLVPHINDAGDYTCYANTSNKYTKESKGITTAITVLSELMYKNPQIIASCKVHAVIVEFSKVIYPCT